MTADRGAPHGGALPFSLHGISYRVIQLPAGKEET